MHSTEYIGRKDFCMYRIRSLLPYHPALPQIFPRRHSLGKSS